MSNLPSYYFWNRDAPPEVATGASEIYPPNLTGFSWILYIVPTHDVDTRDTPKKQRRTDDIAKKFGKTDGINESK